MHSKVEAMEEEIDLREYLNVLVKRWWVIVIITSLATAGALGASLTSPPVYRASATIVWESSSAKFGLTPGIVGIGQQASVDTLAEIVKSRAVAERALVRLGIPQAEREEVLQQFQSGLMVQRIRGTDLIRIQAEGPTPQEAAAATNAVAEAFLAWHIEARRAQARAAREFIDSQLATVRQELQASEDALARYKASGGQISLSEQTTLAVSKLAEFEAQQRAVAAERQGLNASLNQARAALQKQLPTIPSSFVTAEDPVVASLRSELAKLEVDLAALREQFTDRHPRVIATNTRIEEVKAQLQQRAARTLASQTATLNPLHQDLLGQIIKLEVEQQALQARESALQAIVNKYTREIRALPPKEVQLARLTRNLKVAEETYLLLSQKLQEARIEEASIVGDLRIVDRAIPSTTPVKPKTGLNTILGAVVGLMVGTFMAFLMEALDTTFKTPEEVEQVLGVPLLATIPLWRGPRRSQENRGIPLIMAEHRRSPFAEAFRHLRTNLLYLSPDRPLRRLLITSPGPGEGKDTVAANLAIAISQLGQRVWLLDCDLRRRELFWSFQPETPFGLVELLVDGMGTDQIVHPTKVESLQFIPCGVGRPPNPAELLASQKMRSFLEQSRNGTDVLVVNTPPVLPVTDAVVLAPAVDGVLLVVRIGKTPREAARRARQQIESVGGRVVGVVVNGVPLPRRGSHYYYYSYYYDTEPEVTQQPSR